MATLSDLNGRLNLRLRKSSAAIASKHADLCRAGAALPRLIVMSDSERLPDPVAIIDGLPSGTTIILRHYSEPNRRSMADRLVRACRPRRLRVLVAGDAQLAVAVGANGVHLPEHLVAAGSLRWRAWRRPDWLVTAAAHSHSAIVRAHRVSADAVLVSPVFPTISHSEAAPIGPLRFAAMCRASHLPVYALGGVTPELAFRLIGSGAVGIAGISGFYS